MCGDNKVDDEVDDTSNNDGNHQEKKKYAWGSQEAGKPKEYDPTFKGPLKKRSCTDIICCLIFFILILGTVVCSIIGYARGNPVKLIYPTDSDGNICGTGSKSSTPNLVFFDLLQCTKMGATAIVNGCPTPQVCVASCPTTYYVYLETKARETTAGSMIQSERDKLICKSGVDATSQISTQYSYHGQVGFHAGAFCPCIQFRDDPSDVSTYITNDECAAYYVPTTAVVGRCIPSIFLTIVDQAATLTTSNGTSLQSADGTSITGNLLDQGSYFLSLFFKAKEHIELVFKDLVTAWYLILVGLGLAVVLCFLWIIVLRFIAGIIIWITIVAFIGLWGFGIYYSYSEYYSLKNSNATQVYSGISTSFADNFSYFTSLKETWLAIGCTGSTLLIIFLLILLFLISRIRIAIELIKEGSRAIGNMIFTLIWPIIPFLLQLALLAYFAVSIVYIAALESAQYYNNGTNTTSDGGVTYYLERTPCSTTDTTTGSLCEFVKYGGDTYIYYLIAFMVFMFLWTMNFVVALGQMVLAGAFASYYWAWEKPRDIPAFPLGSSLWRAFRYHIGTLAFGSLIVAIIQMIRIGLEYLDQKLKGTENPVAKFLLKCLKCCFWCLEKIIKFINKNAYIMCAIYGKNFCTSAKEAFFLIIRNVVRAVVLDKLVDYVLLLSKLLITAAVGVGAFYWFQGNHSILSNYVPTLNFYLTPVIVLIIGTFLITCCFFSVFSMAVDTLFLCFLEDLERHDGSAEKPYYMNKGLMKLLGKKNKIDKKVRPQEMEQHSKDTKVSRKNANEPDW